MPWNVCIMISFWRALRASIAHLLLKDGLVVAGYVAFTAIFALFPFMMMLVSVAGFLGHGEAAAEVIELGLEIVPPEVAGVLRPAIEDVKRSASSGAVTFGLVLTLWFASSGLEAVRHVLDRAYGIEDLRSFLVNRLQSLVLVLFVGIALIGAMLALVAAPFIRDLAEWLARRELFDHDLYFFLRIGIGLALLLGITLCLHLVLPAAKLRVAEVWPGTILSVALWAIAAELYSDYLQSLATSYSVTYGSLAGVVLTLFFFYISAAVFILGAELNGNLRRNRRPVEPAPTTDQPARATVSNRAKAALSESNRASSTVK